MPDERFQILIVPVAEELVVEVEVGTAVGCAVAGLPQQEPVIVTLFLLQQLLTYPLNY